MPAEHGGIGARPLLLDEEASGIWKTALSSSHPLSAEGKLAVSGLELSMGLEDK